MKNSLTRHKAPVTGSREALTVGGIKGTQDRCESRVEGETECSDTVSFDVNITWVASKREPLNDLKT